MSRRDDLKAAVADAYANGMHNFEDLADWTDEQIAEDMLDACSTVAEFVDADWENVDEVAAEIVALLPEVTP